MPALLKAPTRIVRSRVFDSTRWDGYRPCPDDIIIGTYSKCGTTWMQRIVGMLVFRSAAPRAIAQISPWFDMRLFGSIKEALEAAEAQTHRRFLKTHLPLDALPIYEGGKFIHVARDGRDAAVSLHNHLLNFSPELRSRLDEVSIDDPKFGDPYPPIPESPAAFFADWVTDGGSQGDPGASFFHVENTYWEARDQPNMLLVHYNDLKTDLEGEMRRVAAYLGIEIADSLWPELIQAAGFKTMQAQGDVLLPHAKHAWNGGAARFFNKGTNGRWRNVVSPSDLTRYEEAIDVHFPPDLAYWIEKGRLGCSQDLKTAVDGS
ncbi:MAG: sulfotransferase domain-containing protein [Candidatus Binatia bacterium]